MSASLRASLALSLALMGCRTETDVAAIPAPEEDIQVSFVLDADTAIAGQALGYTVDVTNRGEPIEATWRMSSELEAALLYSLEDLTPVIAGEHTLLVDVQSGDWQGEVEATLVVGAASVYDLDLRLSDAATLAGIPVSYEVDAVDAFGNTVDAQGATVLADSTDVAAWQGALTGTVPGAYLITATLDGLEDVEPLWIDPGVPETIDLTLSSMILPLNGTAAATVDVRDVYGNETWAAWTLTTDRPSATRVSGRNITFVQEGWHTVTATLDVSGLSDSEGPLLIDDTGPVINPTWPERAEWTTALTETVRGAVSDAWSDVSLTINDQGVTVATDGSYSMGMSLPWGVSVVNVEASDAAGNTSSTTSAVLAGTYLGYGHRAPDTIRARLNEGNGGLGTLEVLGEGLIDSQDLASLIPNPVYANRSEDCWEVCIPWVGCWRECVEWYRVDLRVNNPYLGPSDLQIDPRSDGRLNLRLIIDNPRLNWTASGRVLGVGSSASGAIVADYFQVDLRVKPRVRNGNLYMDLESVNTTAVGFDFQWADWLQDVLNFFGFNADAYLAGLMEDAIDDAVADAVPPVLAEALNSFELYYPISLGGAALGIDANFSSVSVDNSGIGLGLGTRVVASSWSRPPADYGSLYGAFTPPSGTSSPKTQIMLSVDVLNQVAYAAWGAGLLDITESADDLGLPEEELQLFLPGVTSITAVVNPLLPPTVVPGTGAETYDLQMGDIELTLYSGNPANNDIIIRVYITAITGLSIGAVGDDRLSANVGNADFWFDVTVPEGNSQAAGDTEALVEAIVPLLLPRIADVFGEIAIPSFAGFKVNNVSVNTGGEQDAWFRIGGNLAEE